MRVLLMRVALYGSVLVIGGVLLSARPGGGDAAARVASGLPARHLDGRTSEGLRASAITHFGQVRYVHVMWRMRCDHERRERSAIGFRGGFRRHVDGFWVGGPQRRTFHGGLSLRYVADVTGRAAGDGRSASGRGSLVETWYRHGRVVNRCRSGEVRWGVGPGMPRLS